MKKIIYLSILLLAFSACSNEKMDKVYPLLNSVWETEKETETVDDGVFTRVKTLTFSTKSSGTLVDRTIFKTGDVEVYNDHINEIFTYEVLGKSIYVEIEDIPASFTGTISNNVITLSGLDGDNKFIKQ